MAITKSGRVVERTVFGLQGRFNQVDTHKGNARVAQAVFSQTFFAWGDFQLLLSLAGQLRGGLWLRVGLRYRMRY